METVDAAHAIMEGFPAVWNAPSDELYVAETVWPEARPLVTAYGIETERDHVVVWTNTFGAGRVFSTTLGHGNETVGHSVFLDMLDYLEIGFV